MELQARFIYFRPLFIFSGKVHGSLARAGKVKAQTPKVSIRYLLKKMQFIYLFRCISAFNNI